MEVNIKNHKDGKIAEVTKHNQLRVRAEVNSQQHFVSHNFGQAYQAFGSSDTLTAATHTVLHIKNDDANRDLIISDISLQLVGADASDAITDYFEMGFDRTVSSGGAAMIPVNMNRKVGSVAEATATTTSPTMAGTFVATERWYPQASGEFNEYNKDGSIVLGLGKTFEIRYISTATAGIAEARIAFLMVDE